MRCLAAVICGLALAAVANAQTPDMDMCAGSSGTGAEQMAACNRAIATPGLSADELARAHYNRAIGWTEQGQNDRAIADYNDAIRLNPRDVGSYLNRGIAYGRKGDFDKAMEDLTRAIQISPKYADAYFYRSIVAGRKGDNTLAMSDFRMAATLNPAQYKNSPTQAADIFTCFNDSGQQAAIGLWAYEGQTEVNAARRANGPTLVLGFPRGQDLIGKDYAPNELVYCWFTPNPQTQRVVKCSSGLVRIARIESKASLAGEYRFLLENGQVKSLKFTASYCPPAKPAAQK